MARGRRLLEVELHSQLTASGQSISPTSKTIRLVQALLADWQGPSRFPDLYLQSVELPHVDGGTYETGEQSWRTCLEGDVSSESAAELARKLSMFEPALHVWVTLTKGEKDEAGWTYYLDGEEAFFNVMDGRVFDK